MYRTLANLQGVILDTLFEKCIDHDLCYSSEWRTISDKMADTITNMNRSVLYSIANKGLEEIYIDNYNTTIKSIGDELVGN